LGEVFQVEVGGAGGDLGGGAAELELEALGFKRAEDAEADGRGEQAAEVLVEEEVGGGFGRDGELTEEEAVDGSEVTGVGRRRGFGEEGVGEGGPEGAALEAAGSVRDVIGEPGVAVLVQLREAGRFPMGHHDEGEGGGGGLEKVGLEKGFEVVAVRDFAQLPRRLDTSGVSESASGQRGVRDLEDEMEVGSGQKSE